MKERPILFSAPMVRAILAGTKTQTRRIVKPERVAQALDFLGGATDDLDPPGIGLRWGQIDNEDGTHGPLEWLACCAEYPEEGFEGIGVGYGAVGDRLWVRETWNEFPPWVGYFYAADDHSFGIGEGDDPDHIEPQDIRWRPSIHMPRLASRITLEIAEVRVERLQDISEADAMAEGMTHELAFSEGLITRVSDERPMAVKWYQCLWEQINGSGSWDADANPWVWVLSFKRIAP